MPEWHRRLADVDDIYPMKLNYPDLKEHLGSGEPAPVYSIGSGIDYPSVGPEHAYLRDIGRTVVGTCNDAEAVDAFYKLSQLEGIIPALESAHAVAYAMKLAKENPKDSILINLSGRGDKDIDFVIEHHPIPARP